MKQNFSRRSSFDLEQSLEIPEEYLCPITKEIMKDPVVLASGHTYDRQAIEHWFRSGARTDPNTNMPLRHRTLTPNVQLRQAIQRFLESRPILAKQLQEQQDYKLAVDIFIRQKEEQERKQRAEALLGPVGPISRPYPPRPRGALAEEDREPPSIPRGEEYHPVNRKQMGLQIMAFLEAMRIFLRSTPGSWDLSAAESFVGGFISLLTKGEEAYRDYQKNPELHSIPLPVAEFIQNYVGKNPFILDIRYDRQFGQEIKGALYRGEVDRLYQQFRNIE